MHQRGKFEEVLGKLKEGGNLTDNDISKAFSELKDRYPEISGLIFDDRLKMAVYSLIQRGIVLADEDLFHLCDEHDSLRRLVYRVVKLMDLRTLEKASNEILAKDLERTLLGSYILKRISNGRGGGT